MKIKLYTPIVATTVHRSEEKPHTNIVCYGSYASRSSAQNQLDHMHDYYSVKEENGNVKLPREYCGSMVHFRGTVHEEVIDTDNYEEHKPDYDVELEVTITKRVQVTVSADDMESRGFTDDCDVDTCADQMFDEGEFDHLIEEESEWERECEVREYYEA